MWDGDKLVAELGPTGATKVAEYSYYPAGLDELHAINVGGSTNYYAHTDAIGNVRALTDGNGNVRRTYNYDEWGQLYANSSDGLPFNGADRARWKGALWMGPELDIYYMRNRWYEPRTGRFLSEDPIGLAGGINPYVYAGADPVNGSDPSGLSPCGRGEFGHWDGGWGEYWGYMQRTTTYHECAFGLGAPAGLGPRSTAVKGGSGGGGGPAGTNPNAIANEQVLLDLERMFRSVTQAGECAGASFFFGANLVGSASMVGAAGAAVSTATRMTTFETRYLAAMSQTAAGSAGRVAALRTERLANAPALGRAGRGYVNPGVVGAATQAANPQRPNWSMLVPFAGTNQDAVAVANACGASTITSFMP